MIFRRSFAGVRDFPLAGHPTPIIFSITIQISDQSVTPFSSSFPKSQIADYYYFTYGYTKKSFSLVLLAAAAAGGVGSHLYSVIGYCQSTQTKRSELAYAYAAGISLSLSL